MLKLTKTIVNGQRSLIGFMVEGKESEMGGFSNIKIERGIPVEQMIKTKFSNNQVAVVKGKLVERGNFKINQLPMCVYSPGNASGNEYIDIDSTMNLIGRYVQNNENIGFRVQFADGSEDNLRYANVIMMCKWFKPGNFSIRTSSKQNLYICSKKDGTSINDLPAQYIEKNEEAKAPKRMKSAAKKPVVEFNGAVETGFDILDIYGFIKDCNGAVIKLPNEKYNAASEDGETIVEGFQSLGIGEVALPYPMYNASKINVNAQFKKVGVVPVTINGQQTNITTFVHRNKSIFLNGDNYIKKFGIAVPTEKEADLLKALGGSLGIKKIEDPTIIQPLSQVINVKSLSFYMVDSSKIDLISEQKRSESIMNAKQLVVACKKMYDLKLISKALGPKGGVLKELAGCLSDSDMASATGKKLFGIFSMMNEEALNAIKEAGIDVYTGAYTVAGKPVAKAEGSGDGDSATPVEIEYTLTGFDHGKITGKQVIEAVKTNDTSKITENVAKCVGEILSIEDEKSRYKAAKEMYDKVEKEISKLNEKFWRHNASMYINGSKTRIHSHDSKNWVPDTNTRVKKYQVYTCKIKGAEGLTVKFNGVSI